MSWIWSFFQPRLEPTPGIDLEQKALEIAHDYVRANARAIDQAVILDSIEDALARGVPSDVVLSLLRNLRKSFGLPSRSEKPEAESK